MCGVLAQLVEKETAFQAAMTNLNGFIRHAHLDKPLATRLRAYFRYHHGRTDITDFTDLLDKMSPDLRGAVAISMNSGWIANVPYFRGCSKSMLIRLSFIFEEYVYPPSEVLLRPGEMVSRMFILRRGLVMLVPQHRKFSVRTSGNLIGEEIFWATKPTTTLAMTMTYVDVQQARRGGLG